jgi:hypothetical protein
MAIGEGLAVNKSIIIIKLHRQQLEYGAAAEEVLVKLYETNTTIQRCYATLHDRTCSQNNTRGETRNKTIAARIEAGKDWIDLDPTRRNEYAAQLAAERKAKAEAEAQAKLPVTEKVESTGGPYTYKQLTCDLKFRPDDIAGQDRSGFLSEEEFAKIFGMAREAFSALPAWKANNLKKTKNLH